jgi:hypothetical protein
MDKDIYAVPDYDAIRVALLDELAELESISSMNIDQVLDLLYTQGLIGDSINQNLGGLAIAPIAIENWSGMDGRIELRYFSPAIQKEIVFHSDITPEELSKESFVDFLIETEQEVRSFEEALTVGGEL